MVDVFEHSARLDTAAVEVPGNLVQITANLSESMLQQADPYLSICAANSERVIPASSACWCKSSCTTSVTRAEITFVFTIDFTFFFVLGMGSPFQNQEFDFPGSASALRL